MTRVAILQPNYIPWKGVFDMIHQVDQFIFLDDVQYTARDWRSRNKIKIADGTTRWLSVPVRGGRDQRICDVAIDESQGWRRKHVEAMRHSYGRAPFYPDYAQRFAEILERPSVLLADLDIELTVQICAWLGLRCEFKRSSELAPTGAKDERLIDVIQKVGGTSYLSGPAARAYVRPELFAGASIELRWMNYSDYPVYPQISDPFEHGVTVMDLLFAVGSDAPDYIWGKHRHRAASNSALQNG